MGVARSRGAGATGAGATSDEPPRPGRSAAGATRAGPLRRAARAWAVLALATAVQACGDTASDPDTTASEDHHVAASDSPSGDRCTPLRTVGPARARSVVFVLADTLRRDRLGAYGGPAATPSFDAFARDAILFGAASSQAPWTKPSIATLFTGRLPSSHGVVSHPELAERLEGEPAREAVVESDVLAEDADTLAEALASAGYGTAAFVSNPWLQRRLGFGQGFDVYDDRFAANATPGEVVTRAGLAWVAARRSDPSPFFLYLHYMDPHAPFDPLTPRAIERRRAEIVGDDRPVTAEAAWKIASIARAPDGLPVVGPDLPASIALMELLYDQGVERFDRVLGVLLRQLRRLDPEREWAIVVASDHGEAFYDRGWGEHGYGLFEDEIGVPLAMWLPGVAPDGAADCAVGLVDVLPTLCDYLGVECPTDHDGRSLFREDIADPDRTVWMEGAVARPEVRAVRRGRWKLLAEPLGAATEIAGTVSPELGPFALYDLRNDPGEQHDLVPTLDTDAEARAAFARLRAELDARPLVGATARGERVPLDAASRARLEALGYLEPAERTEATGAKDAATERGAAEAASRREDADGS